ncbi:MAG: DNA-3-methyladenine glycosylase I [Tepidiformaceae bacterium]
MDAPTQIKPEKLADYLEVLSKAVFEAGMNWKVIENKWPGFREAFDGFDPQTIGEYTPDDIDRLMSDPRIIRNGRKVEATIHNAKAMLEIEKEFGSFAKYLAATRPFDSQLADIKKRFKHVGNFGVFYFLYVVGEEVPPHEEYTAKLKGNAVPQSRQRLET